MLESLEKILDIKKEDFIMHLEHDKKRRPQIIFTVHLNDFDENSWNYQTYTWWKVTKAKSITRFLNLDYRENDLVNTLKNDWYILVWELDEKMPEYIIDFLRNSNVYDESDLKIINRTDSYKNLIFLNLTKKPKIKYISDWVVKLVYQKINNK